MIITFFLSVITVIAEGILTMFSLRFLQLFNVNIFSADNVRVVFDWFFGLLTFFQSLVNLSTLFVVIQVCSVFFLCYLGYVMFFFVVGIAISIKHLIK